MYAVVFCRMEDVSIGARLSATGDPLCLDVVVMVVLVCLGVKPMLEGMAIDLQCGGGLGRYGSSPLPVQELSQQMCTEDCLLRLLALLLSFGQSSKLEGH